MKYVIIFKENLKYKFKLIKIMILSISKSRRSGGFEDKS